MSRVTIDLPNTFPFSTELTVYISHINRGDHLGNESLLSFLNEARMRYMNWVSECYPETAIKGIINADLAIIYKSEGKYGDKITIDVAPANFSKYGCDFIMRVRNSESGNDIAHAKMAMLQYDYEIGQLAPVPAEFEKWLSGKPQNS